MKIKYKKIRYVIYDNEAYPFYNEEKFMGILYKSATIYYGGMVRIRTGKPDEKGYYNAHTVRQKNCIFVYEGEEEKYAEYLI
jgi:hypothetical protein